MKGRRWQVVVWKGGGDRWCCEREEVAGVGVEGRMGQMVAWGRKEGAGGGVEGRR